MEGKLSAYNETWIPQVIERPTPPNFIPPNEKDVKGDGVGKTSARLTPTAFKDHQVIQKEAPTTDLPGVQGTRPSINPSTFLVVVRTTLSSTKR